MTRMLRADNRSGHTFRTNLPGLCGFVLFVVSQFGHAATPSGTTISNQASISYTVAASAPLTATSNVASFLVDKKVNVLVAAGTVTSVSAGQSGAVIAFPVTNLGNDPQGIVLAAAPATGNPATGGSAPFTANDFIATGLVAYADSNNNGLYEPLLDTATTIPSLAAGTSQNVFVVGDIPAATPLNQQSVVSLAAAAVEAATMATLVATAGADTAGVDVVFVDSAGMAAGDVARDAMHSAYGAYLADGVNVVLTKSVLSVLDPQGTAVVMPGAVLTYRIAVTVSGTGTVTGLTITDPLPANTSYVQQSIAVNGVARTDAADADNAQLVAVPVPTVSVSLGNVAAPANFVITFRATIN